MVTAQDIKKDLPNWPDAVITGWLLGLDKQGRYRLATTDQCVSSSMGAHPWVETPLVVEERQLEPRRARPWL